MAGARGVVEASEDDWSNLEATAAGPPVAHAPAPPPPPPAPVVHAKPPPEIQVVERIVYRTRPGVVTPATAPVAELACPSCPDCPDCKPVINVTPPAEKSEGPWGFIAAALGGAASVIAAAFAKKFLGVSAEG